MLALTALSRPVFALFPVGLVLVGLVFFPLTGVTRRPSLGAWAVLLAAFAIAMLPWFTYNYVTLGQLTLSPAGGMGRGTWEGSWQATWSGRLQNELTLVAEATDDRASLDARVETIAAREHLSAAPMLEYVHQWQDIRRIWTTPTVPRERVAARVQADREYMRVGLSNIRRQSAAHIAKRLARGVFILWAGEIPVRYSDINTLPTIVKWTIWGIQALLFAGRDRRRLRAHPLRTGRRRLHARRRTRLRHGGALPHPDRGTPVAAGPADAARARRVRCGALTCPETADS